MPLQAALKVLARLTDTQPAAWEPMVGPDSDRGVDYWYRHPSGREASINNDHGHVTIRVEGEKVTPTWSKRPR